MQVCIRARSQLPCFFLPMAQTAGLGLALSQIVLERTLKSEAPITSCSDRRWPFTPINRDSAFVHGGLLPSVDRTPCTAIFLIRLRLLMAESVNSQLCRRADVRGSQPPARLTETR